MRDTTPLACPNCQNTMTQLTLQGHYGNDVFLDHCETCKIFWFDPMETAALSKTGLQEMFALIGHGAVSDTQLSDKACCPRCRAPLHAGFDLTRFGKTRHYRCPAKHGHAVTHLQFLAEKGLLRKPSEAEFHAPESKLLNAPCQSCGAPLDALVDGNCPYCNSAVIVIDLQKALQTLEIHAQAPLYGTRNS